MMTMKGKFQSGHIGYIMMKNDQEQVTPIWRSYNGEQTDADHKLSITNI